MVRGDAIPVTWIPKRNQPPLPNNVIRFPGHCNDRRGLSVPSHNLLTLSDQFLVIMLLQPLLRRWSILVAIALASSAMSACNVDGTFNLQGHEKDAWPELLHSTVDDTLQTLKSSGIVEKVYVQPPSSGTPPANPKTSTDVWLYTDGNNVVYEIPKRGVWHPNRLSPGWPELAGQDYKAAISKIAQDYLGVTVVYGPKGFFRVQDFQLDRVWLDVNPNGSISGVPAIG